MKNLETLKYEGSPITFESKDCKMMVNATQMAKAFPRKRLNDILESKEMIEYLQARNPETEISASTDSQFVKIIKGGIPSLQGTWVDEKVALRIAQKLSPKFAVWVDDRVGELLKYGATAINPEDLLNPDFIINLATQLKESRINEAKLNAKITKDKPKVDVYNKLIESDVAIPIGQFAKMVGWGQNNLFKKLREDKYLMSNGVRRNTPYQKYIDSKLFEVKERVISLPNDETVIKYQTLMLPKGQEYFSKILSN